ncbi:unnamed protein product [Lactuca virosa]|uniref:Uncharacterized protein n=1 Tax=Lactuca virosa TaxID=75947 RepID=A0AAU9MYY1_9ASTR|nr:unnamed protein product [Lactuca virosa]
MVTSSSRSVIFDELPSSSPDLIVHRPTTSRSASFNEQKRNSHKDEGDGNEDDDGVDLMKRSRSPARRQSRQCDSSKEGEAFVNNEAFDGGGKGDSGVFFRILDKDVRWW